MGDDEPLTAPTARFDLSTFDQILPPEPPTEETTDPSTVWSAQADLAPRSEPDPRGYRLLDPTLDPFPDDLAPADEPLAADVGLLEETTGIDLELDEILAPSPPSRSLRIDTIRPDVEARGAGRPPAPRHPDAPRVQLERRRPRVPRAPTPRSLAPESRATVTRAPTVPRPAGSSRTVRYLVVGCSIAVFAASVMSCAGAIAMFG